VPSFDNFQSYPYPMTYPHDTTAISELTGVDAACMLGSPSV
jgi:hypothetical protein